MQEAKKSLGQHWLSDPMILSYICVQAGIKKGDCVLEIGPGKGDLTAKLLEMGAEVVAVEIDKCLEADLRKKFNSLPFTLNMLSIMDFDLSKMPKDYKVVANIPYYLTSHLLRMLSETQHKPAIIVLLVQKEVAERIAAKPGKMSLLLSEFDFRELTEQVAYMLSPLIREKKQIFSVDMAETTSFLISADEGKLRQILTNLLSNAIKFTSEGGRITVSASYRSPKTVPAVPNALPADRFLYVEVKDTGIGISDENQSELFQPFKQVDPSFTRRYPGTGLGLALCKELIELHGGKIGVTSVAGDGSQFFFYLPLVQAVTLVPAAV